MTDLIEDPFKPLQALDIPPALQESFNRHRDSVLSLVVNLRTAGMSAKQIETSVSSVVESYKTELLLAIKSLTES